MNRINEVRIKKGLTQKQLAELLGMDQGTLSKIIHDLKEINLTTAKKFRRILGFGMDYLWPDE